MHEIADAIRIGLFNKKVINRVSKDKNTTNLAFILFFLATILSSLITPLYFGETKLSFSTDFFLILICNVFLFILIHSLSKLFGSKTTFISFFRPVGYSHMLDILFVFAMPVFEGIAKIVVNIIWTIWFFLILILIIKEAYKFSLWKAIVLFVIVWLITIGVIMLFVMIIFLAFPNIFENLLALSD